MGPFTVLFGFLPWSIPHRRPPACRPPWWTSPWASWCASTATDSSAVDGGELGQAADLAGPHCGCGADGAELQRFAEALGPALAARLRRLYYQRELEDLTCRCWPIPPKPRCWCCPSGRFRPPSRPIGLRRPGAGGPGAAGGGRPGALGQVGSGRGDSLAAPTMNLIAAYRKRRLRALADGVMAFSSAAPTCSALGGLRPVGEGGDAAGSAPEPAKVSTTSAWWRSTAATRRLRPGRSDPAGRERRPGPVLKERPLLRDCCPEQSLFVNPIFNLQRYAPGEGFSAGM